MGTEAVEALLWRRDVGIPQQHQCWRCWTLVKTLPAIFSTIATTAICFKMNPFSPRIGGAWKFLRQWYAPTKISESLASASLGASDLSHRYYCWIKTTNTKSVGIAYSGNTTNCTLETIVLTGSLADLFTCHLANRPSNILAWPIQ